MSIVQILGLLLALSVAGNAWLGRSYLGQRDVATVAVVRQEQATGAAVACSQGTEALQVAAVERAADNKPAVARAAASAIKHEQVAQQILQAPASAPGDDCKSADDAFNDWISARAPK